MFRTEQKTNNGKLLVAVLALAMIFAGCIVLMGDDVQATDVDTQQEFIEALEGNDSINVTQTITLSNIEGGVLDLNGKTITVSEGANLNIDGIKLQNGSITGSATTYNGQYILGMHGASTIEKVDIESTGAAAPCAVLVFSGATANITNCEITTDGDGNFGAIQVSGTTTITGGNIAGFITYNVYTGTGLLTINGCSDIILNFPNSTTVDNNILILNNTTVSETVIGWDTSNSNASVPGNSDPVNIVFDDTYDLGTIRPAESDQFTGDKSVSEGTNGDISGSTISEGITYNSNDGSKNVASYDELVAAIGNGTDNSVINVVGDIVLKDSITIGVNQTVNFNGVTVTRSSDTSVINVNGLMTIDNSYIYVPAVVDEDAVLDVINAHQLTSTGTLNDSTQVGVGDTLTLSGTVPENRVVDVYGTLITSDLTVNGTVNAYQGSTVSIEGTVTVAKTFTLQNGAELELSGTVNVRNDRNGDATFTISDGAKMTVTSEGTLNVNRATANGAPANTLDVQGTLVLEGTMNVTGTLTGEVQNKGTLTFNGTSDDAKVVMYDGVSMTVTSVTGKMTVTDGDSTNVDVIADYLGITSEQVASLGYKTSLGNSVELENVRGITVSETITSASDVVSNQTVRSYMGNMTVSGTATIVTGQTDGGVSVNGACKKITEVTDETRIGTLTIGDTTVGAGITYTFTGTVTVSGNFTAVAPETSGSNPLAAAAVINNGKITVTGMITASADVANALESRADSINAVKYTVTGTDDNATRTTYYTNFADAIAAVGDADDDTITVLGDVETSADAQLASGMTITVNGALTIGADYQLDIAAGALLSINGKVDVQGVLVINDNNTGLTTSGRDSLVYDVLKTVENTDTYSSLAYALENAASGETITLSKGVDLRTDTEIPEGVTLVVPRNTYLNFVEDVTLTVNGTLTIQATDNGIRNGTSGTWGEDVSIVVNGVMGSASVYDYSTYKISGAYFTLRGTNYISNVVYAAENIGNESAIAINGTVTTADVTFTAGNTALTVTVNSGATFNAGTVTLDGATLDIDGTMSGTVAAAADGSTASVQLDRVAGVENKDGTVIGPVIASDSDTTVDGDVDYLYIGGYVNSGTATVASGTVTVNNSNLVINTTNADVRDGAVVIASGATLDVPSRTVLHAQANSGTAKTVLSVAGTLDVDGTVNITGQTAVAGILTINEGARVNLIQDANVTSNIGSMTVTGTVDAVQSDDGKGTLSITKGAHVAVESGSVSGTVAPDTTSYLIAYPGADLANAQIAWNDSTEESDADSTQFVVNGEIYMTVYGSDNSQVVIQNILNAITFDIPGYDVGLKKGGAVAENTILYNVENWYTDAGMAQNTRISDASAKIGGDYDVIYSEVQASYIDGTISEGTGLDLYIDNIRYDPNNAMFREGLQVGTHTVSFEVTAGYDGSNATITFNGQTIQNGGTITITADMDGFTLVANGAVPASYPSGSGSSDDGMGLTDYLLIILVILIVIMAIMVAMRLMRS